MVKVKRGNVVLRVEEIEVNKYMAKGFSVIDGNGNVIRQSVPTEIGQLQKAYSEHLQLLKEKDTEIAKLKSELEALKNTKTAGEKKTPAAKTKTAPIKEEVEEPTDSADWDGWDDAEELEEEKPVKKSKKSK